MNNTSLSNERLYACNLTMLFSNLNCDTIREILLIQNLNIMSLNSILMDGSVAEIAVSYSQSIRHKDRIKVTNFNIAVDILRKVWNLETMELQETFMLMLLNRNNQLLGVVNLSKGGITGTVLDIRLMFGIALKSVSTGIIMAHNHPSGNTTPSDIDRKITDRVQKAASLLDITLHDHIILTEDDQYSFAHNGLLANSFSSKDYIF